MNIIEKIKKYKIYIVLLLILSIGFVYSKSNQAGQKKLKLIESDHRDEVRTVMINTALYNKTPEEKKIYLLNNFDMDFVVGDKNTKVTIIEYSSFGCKYCRKMRPEIDKIIDEYVLDKKLVRYVLRPMYNTKTIPIGAFINCSRHEDKRNIINEIFSKNIDLINDYQEYLTEIGKKFNMDEEYVKECIYNKETYEKIIYMQRNSKEVFSINATPMFIINGQEIFGYRSYEQMKNIIENLLKGRKDAVR